MHIVFLHGFMGAPREFLWLAASMPCPTEMISLPGHGCSDARVTFDNAGDWLEEQLIGLKVKECVLYGYSLGGRIALNYVLNQSRPKVKVKGLILESAAIGLADKNEAKERQKADHVWAENFRTQPMVDTLSKWYQQRVFADLNDEDRKFMIKQKANLNGSRMADCLEDLSLGRMPFFGPMLKQLDLPVLFLHGSRDEKFKKIGTQLTGYQNPNLVVKEIPKAGHNCHFANMSAVIANTKDFLLATNLIPANND